jgi:2-oxoglutarate dehydrogenase E2 component (dihydrolipoamide succinyltransferase)
MPPAPEREAAPPAPSARPVDDKKAEAPGALRETRQRLSSIRLRIAERLVAAQHTAAILTTFNEADLSAVIRLRTDYKEAFQQKYGVNLGFMSFFVKAAVEALRAFPVVNAWIDGSDIVFHHDYNIGVAVSTDKGLMVPVLREAESMSFGEIEKRIAELSQKAREGKITVEDLQGGTFTITNGGVFGSLLSTPILNPPQSAILGMHAIQQRPVAVNGQVVIRPMMYLALSYDHRLIDGRDAVQFLVRIKNGIENPERMLLEV